MFSSQTIRNARIFHSQLSSEEYWQRELKEFVGQLYDDLSGGFWRFGARSLAGPVLTQYLCSQRQLSQGATYYMSFSTIIYRDSPLFSKVCTQLWLDYPSISITPRCSTLFIVLVYSCDQQIRFKLLEDYNVLYVAELYFKATLFYRPSLDRPSIAVPNCGWPISQPNLYKLIYRSFDIPGHYPACSRASYCPASKGSIT